MAPELFEEKGVYSFASDIWSLGVLLYELGAGKTPFGGDNFENIARNIMENEFQDIKGYSPQFNSLLSKMLTKNPANRISWQEIVTHPWWEGLHFNVPDLPDQPHFEEFLRKYGYLMEIKERPQIDIKIDEKENFVQTMKSEKVSGKAKDTNLLRLSLNVGNNLLREKEDYMDVKDRERIKIDRDQTVDMGQYKEQEREVGEQFVSEVSEDIANSQGSRIKETSGFADYHSLSQNSQKHQSQISGISIAKSTLVGQGSSCFPDTKKALEKFLFNASDRVVRPIIGNTDIEKLDGYDYNPDIGGFKLKKNSELVELPKQQFEDYMIELYRITVNDSIPMKDKLNILHYFINFIQNSDHANMIIESYFMDLFLKILKSAKTKSFKIALCTIIGLLLRYTTNINYEIAKMGIVPLMIELMKDKSPKVKRRAVAVIGEYLFFGATQLDGTPENVVGFLIIGDLEHPN